VAKTKIENRNAATKRLSMPTIRSKKGLAATPIWNFSARSKTFDKCRDIQSAVGDMLTIKARKVKTDNLEDNILRYSGIVKPVRITVITNIDALNLPKIAATMATPRISALAILGRRMCQAKAQNTHPHAAVPATEWVKARWDSQPI